MTRRERREGRAEALRRRAKRLQERSDRRSAANAEEWQHVPRGQPHLVGHHSFKRTKATQERLNRSDEIAYDEHQQAERAATRADGIEAQLARDIYDDDPDAIERLAARIAARETERERMKAANKEFRAKNKEALKQLSEFARDQALPYPSYATTNLGAQIRRDRQRKERLEREAVEPPQFRRMIARFDSDCTRCGNQRLRAGDTILYNKKLGVRCATNCQSDELLNP
jgi:hypothetical protein